eukprot:4081289-Lingulodinium_polyedra.AAC.1
MPRLSLRKLFPRARAGSPGRARRDIWCVRKGTLAFSTRRRVHSDHPSAQAIRAERTRGEV